MRRRRSPPRTFYIKGKKFKWKSLSRIRRQRYFFCFSRRSCQVKFEVVVFLFGCGDARFGKLRFNEDFGKKTLKQTKQRMRFFFNLAPRPTFDASLRNWGLIKKQVSRRKLNTVRPKMTTTTLTTRSQSVVIGVVVVAVLLHWVDDRLKPRVLLQDDAHLQMQLLVLSGHAILE